MTQVKKSKLVTAVWAITLMTMAMTLGDATQDTMLKTNYRYSIETLEPQVYFTTDQARIVLYIKVPDPRVGELTPEQIAEEQNVTRNPCLGLDRPRTPLDRVYHPECGIILTLVETLLDLRHHHRQLWAQCPLVSDAILTIAAHRCLSRAAWLNSCRVVPHHCSMSSDHSR